MRYMVALAYMLPIHLLILLTASAGVLPINVFTASLWIITIILSILFLIGVVAKGELQDKQNDE